VVSDVREGFIVGRKFYKVKVLLPVNQPLKDKLKVLHPSLGLFLVYFVYDKTNRVCSFCGCLGHELPSCRTYGRLLRLTNDLRFVSNPKL
jgi:Zinc knuckle